MVKDILEGIIHDPSLLPHPEAVLAEQRATAEEEEMMEKAAEEAAELAPTEEPAPRKNQDCHPRKPKVQKRRWQQNSHSKQEACIDGGAIPNTHSSAANTSDDNVSKLESHSSSSGAHLSTAKNSAVAAAVARPARMHEVQPCAPYVFDMENWRP